MHIYEQCSWCRYYWCIAMVANRKLNKNLSNKLIHLHVLFQAVAVLIFVIIIWASRN